jgi:hypothetical protein
MPVARWYPSKIDWWLGILLALAPVISVVALIGTLLAGTGVAVALGGLLLLVGVIFGLVLPMRYGIDEEFLVVRHGLIRQRILLKDIVEVVPSRSPLSSPALSLDRLKIRFGQGYFKSAMISPALKAEFLDELAQRASLRRDGERLVR